MKPYSGGCVIACLLILFMTFRMLILTSVVQDLCWAIIKNFVVQKIAYCYGTWILSPTLKKLTIGSCLSSFDITNKLVHYGKGLLVFTQLQTREPPFYLYNYPPYPEGSSNMKEHHSLQLYIPILWMRYLILEFWMPTLNNFSVSVSENIFLFHLFHNSHYMF